MLRKLFTIFFIVSVYSMTAQDLIVPVFKSGDNSVNSYRIPSVITAKDGTIIVFCEARFESWKDKSRTDIVMKSSQDDGKTWSNMKNLTHGNAGAYMDPTPVIDKESGRIMLFTSFWPANDHTGNTNNAFMLYSDDNGDTWSEPHDIKNIMPTDDNVSIIGFGPGNGIQMKGKNFKNRLILPIRLKDIKHNIRYNACAFSTDGGNHWGIGSAIDTDDEFQIAEAPEGRLILNARVPGHRKYALSLNGGQTWTKTQNDLQLPGVSKGCQGSVLGIGNTLYYSGIKGIPATDEYDERARLSIFKSTNAGQDWVEFKQIYDKGAGYSCMTVLKNGKLGVVFENTATPGFTRKSIEGTKPPKRPAEWMNIVFTTLEK